MSTPVGTHGLSCIGDDDYAAYALAMQCNARAIDDSLTANQAEFDAYLNRPWIEVVNSAAIVVDDSSGSGTIGPFGLVGEAMRPGSFNAITTVNGLPSAFSITNPDAHWPQGTYLFGANINWTLAAATASSVRRLMVYGVADDAGSFSSQDTNYDLYEGVDYQGDGGNSGSLSICGMVQSVGELAFIETFFTHTNVAGDLTVAVGQWRLWATYLGSGLVI